MKPITPSLPFLSFPTDEVLRTFRPVRALLVETRPPAGAGYLRFAGGHREHGAP
jgi:hypothetical protein